MDISIQVGSGMEYLSSQRVIHRDLAARNCMYVHSITMSLYYRLSVLILIIRVDINYTIKIADFGLSENLDASKDYFRADQENPIKLPIKWLAPESIKERVFSEKSDVVNKIMFFA